MSQSPSITQRFTMGSNIPLMASDAEALFYRIADSKKLHHIAFSDFTAPRTEQAIHDFFDLSPA